MVMLKYRIIGGIIVHTSKTRSEIFFDDWTSTQPHSLFSLFHIKYHQEHSQSVPTVRKYNAYKNEMTRNKHNWNTHLNYVTTHNFSDCEKITLEIGKGYLATS